MSHEPEYGPGELPGAWARLVNSQGDDEHLELCREALKEVQAETERRVKARNVVLPVRGRYLVQDGRAHRVQTQWIETQGSDRIRLGVVIYKEAL